MKQKAKNIALSLLGGAALVCLSIGAGFTVGDSIETKAGQTTIFESPGASIRMNKQDGLNGIRFPMFMDNTTFNALTSNATIQSEEVTFGTLIIPTDKLTGSLNINTALAMNLVTYGYNEEDEFVNVWTECTDENYPDCMQGYAYVHSIPDTSLDRELTAVGYYTTDGGESYVYTAPIERSVSYVADKAINSGDYSEKQVETLHNFLASYTITFEMDSQTTTQEVKYGKTYNLPATAMTTPVGNTLEWYEKVGETYNIVDLKTTFTATADAQFELRAVEHVTYQTTLRNKENIFGADPSVTYKDGYYYYTYFDSAQRVFVIKSPSLEEVLEGGRTGWGHGNVEPIYVPEEGDELGADIWAPELVYLQGKWYIYISGVPYGEQHGQNGIEQAMFVLECKSQDPTGEWGEPIKLCPTGFEGRYAIDGHAFEYNGQLYYTFSGQKITDARPRIYVCTMSSPTSVNNDAVNISQGSSLEEGPCTIVDGTDLYLMYSKGDYNGVNYRVLYYKLNGTNPLNKNSWSSKGECLQQDSTVDIYCTGHNHMFKGEDGGWWTSYHGVVGTAGAGTDTYLATRRVMVQPVSIVNGTLQFGGPKDAVTITDKDGLYYYNEEKTEYFVNGEGSGRLWKNEGKTFTASTTITRLSSEKDFCAGITLYERKGDGTLNKLLIGVEEEGNLFLCRDYSRGPYKYKYVGWQWDNKGTVNLTVTYDADAKTIKIDIYQDGQEKPWSKTYTLDEINAIVSDKVGDESYAFDLHFTGDFEIGLGGNKGKCKFTNVLFAFETFNVTFIDVYGNKTTQKVESGDTLEIPTFAERAGFEFVGWAEKIGDDTYGEPGEIADLTVNGNREFKAVYEAVGPTYESPALESKLYTHKTLVVNNEEAEMFADGTGTYFFKDAELAQDQAFVMYATIKGGFTSDNIGFVVGTLASNDNHILFQWRKNDIYIWRDGTYGWKGIEDGLYKPGFGTEANDIEMALVYNAGYYYMFMNGTKVFSCKETSDIGWGTKPQSLIGTTGTKKIGLSQYAGESIYSDWGYSTDVNVIAQYIEIDTTLGSELYTGTTKTLENGILSYNASTFGAQTFNDVEIAQGENFVVYATVESGMTAKNVGFVLGTFETSSKFLMFHFRRSQADFATFRDGGGYGWAGTADGIFPCQIGTSGAEIALVYKDGTYYAFLNGTKVCSFGSSYNNGWGGTFNVASQIGTSGTLKVGLSIFEGKAQFSEWGYSTNAEDIEQYIPSIGVEHYTDAYSSIVDGVATYKASTYGVQTFKDVEVAQGENFVVYATVESGMTAQNVGFVLGTFETSSKFLMFHFRRSQADFATFRDGGGYGWAGTADGIFPCQIGTSGAEIALVYKDGTYYAFLNGTKVCSFGSSYNNGWGGTFNVASQIGTSGALKVGLSIFEGKAQFSEWGVSTEESVIETYFPKTFEKPAIGSNIYKATTDRKIAVENNNLIFNTEKGAVFFKGAEVEQGQSYVIYATMSSIESTPDGIGFAVGTLASNNASHAMFLWRANDIYVVRMGDNDWGWSGETSVSFSKTRAAATMALVYKDKTYYMFIDGEQVFEWSETAVYDGWGAKIQSMVGTSGTIKLGLANLSSDATFTDWGYSIDENVVDSYFPKKVEYGALESKLYTSKTLNVSDTQAVMFADQAGTYFLKDVEIEQNQDFVIYATIKGGFTSDNIGFVVGTLEATSNHAMFQWRKNDIYVWRSAGGWAGHADNAYTPGYGSEASNVTIALVYKAGYYYMFMNGTQVFSCYETSDIGWGTKPQSLIGTTGTKKIGFSLYAGEMILTNWGYSIDARVINQYVK